MLGNKRGQVHLHAKIFDGVRRGVLIAESIWPNSAYARRLRHQHTNRCRSDCAVRWRGFPRQQSLDTKGAGRSARAFIS